MIFSPLKAKKQNITHLAEQTSVNARCNFTIIIILHNLIYSEHLAKLHQDKSRQMQNTPSLLLYNSENCQYFYSYSVVKMQQPMLGWGGVGSTTTP